MRGVYTVEFQVSVSVAKTLMYLTNASDMVLEILESSIGITNVDTTEQMNASLTHVTNAASAAGSAVVPAKHEQGDVASSVTAIANLSAEPTTYASVDIDHQGFSSVEGYHYEPIPEDRPIVSPGASIGLRLLDAPSGATVMTMQIKFREIGG